MEDIYYSAQGELVNIPSLVDTNTPTNFEEQKEIFLYPIEIELQKKVKYLLSQNINLRGHGGNHSYYFDNAFYPGAQNIDLRQYIIQPVINTAPKNRLMSLGLEIGDSNYILTASAGHVLDDLRNYLKQYDLKLLGTPESKYITLGGAVVVGAHNGSKLQKSMADYVTEMLVFNGNGDAVRITDPNLFINYGALGIVFRISIKCFRATNISWKRILHNNINDIIITPNTHSLVFGPYSGKVLEVQMYPTNDPPHKSINRRLWEIVPDLVSLKPISKLVGGAFYVFPSLGYLVSEYFLYEPNVIRGKFDYFEPAPRTKVFTLEYGIDQQYLKNVYREIMNLIGKYHQIGTYVSYRFWVRFMPPSDIPNSFAFGRNTVMFELTFSERQPNAIQFAQDIDTIFRSYGGKPHLGKTIISTEATSNYDFSKFKKSIQKFDPNGIYQNNFMKNIF